MKTIPPQILMEAYSRGIFPMADEGKILWFSPRKRGIIPLDERFHVPHGLAKLLKREAFEIRWNTAFRDVMLGCAAREETWIDDVIVDSYCVLNGMGVAHSVECWDDEGLQGGLYGVWMEQAFFGESMFSRKPDASKIALVALVHRLREQSCQLLDTQWLTPHLQQFGGYEISREEYLKNLKVALAPVSPNSRTLDFPEGPGAP